ncbi:MAG: transcription termination factor NusA [Coprobacillus sp.]|nr:transcription termination factor NusA [Coprobacillus sp.]
MAVDFKAFKEALEEIEAQNGVSKETALEVFSDSLVRSFKRKLGGEDANVKLDISLEDETIHLYEIKKVVSEVEDDFLEISLEDANSDGTGLDYHEGDDYYIEYDIDSFEKSSALAVKSNVHQHLMEAEKANLLEQFKDKIGTMVTGIVEKTDEYGGVDATIGKTTVHLYAKDLIGDEKFAPKDHIKMYVADVSSSAKGGAKIHVSRSHEGFLRCLFSEEIHEIYDGTIKIEAIARKAGERSKIAVYSLDPNVDPSGACIGPNGSRIQRIVSQLGNGSTKEKIDIIDYSDNLALFIMDALKPAVIQGINLDEESKKATCVVRDDSLSLAIGKKGVNVRLASQLTETELRVITTEDAEEEGLTYKSFEEIEAEDIVRRSKLVSEDGTKVLPTLPEGYVAPQERVYSEESDVMTQRLSEAEVEEVVVIAPAGEKESEEAAPTVAPVETPTKEEPTISVATTTTLEDLEKSLTEKKESKKSNKTTKKKESKSEEESPLNGLYNNENITRMDIYTEKEKEELDEEELEESEEEEEDIDYEEYEDYY